MKQAVNYMRGSVCARVECPYPERFVNICAQNGIEFWKLRRETQTVVTAYMHIIGYRRLRKLAPGAGFVIEPVRKLGVPYFVWRIRKRYALLIGLVLCVLSVQALSLFICEIEVYGNEKVSAGRILETLEELHVGVGSFGPGVNSEVLANEMILRIPELSWFAINVRGSRASVLVRERIEKPEVADKSTPMMVYAEKSGVVVKMSVLEGTEVVKVGDTVEKGDVLVTGVMESIANGKRAVHAMGEVYARTWYEKSATMPLETMIKEYTGASKEKTSLIIFGKKIKMYLSGRKEWENYDKMVGMRMMKLPTGNVLPVGLETQEYFEYVPERTALSVTDAEKILRELLLEELREELGNGAIAAAVFETSEENGAVTVTLSAECIEQIANTRGFTEDEFYGLESAERENSNE